MIYPIWTAGKRRQARVTGFIDASGTQKFECDFSLAWPSSEGLAEVRRRDQIGFIAESGDIAIPLRFSSTEPFSQGLASVSLGKSFGYIDRRGNVFGPEALSYAESFSDGLGLARVGPDERVGFVGRDGLFRVPPVYQDGRRFADGLAPVAEGRRWKIIDHENHVAAMFDETVLFVGPQSDGYFCVNQGDFVRAYADANAVIRSPRYAEATAFSEGRAAVRRNDGRCGYVDRNFNWLFESGSRLGGTFHSGRAVAGDDLLGVIDESGNWILSPRYRMLTSFCRGLAMFESETTVGYLNRDGDIVWEGSWCEPYWTVRGLS